MHNDEKNPMQPASAVDPCDFVIFGGTGDLAIRKLLPALYLRDRDGQLTVDTRIIAVARAGLDEPGYRDKIAAELGRFIPTDLMDTDAVERFLARLRFIDSSGLRVLVDIRNTLAARGRTLRMISLPPIARRTIEIVGLVELLGVASASTSDGTS